MNTTTKVIIALAIPLAFAGNYSYQKFFSPAELARITDPDTRSNEEVGKCITADGKVIFGSPPPGVICQKESSVQLSDTNVMEAPVEDEHDAQVRRLEELERIKNQRAGF